MLKRKQTIPGRPGLAFSVVMLALISAGSWFGFASLRLYSANMRELKSPLQAWAMDGARERVLVVAPHCDDETLGCAGVIRDVLAKGGRVQVVVVTNGDGFYELVRRVKRAGPQSYIKLGLMRREETRTAMRLLGVPDEDIIFLGYPDRGISGMWLNNWMPNDLYTSRYTKCSYSPYEDTFRRRAPYCGRALLADLESIILSFRPTTIYSPHPSDQHTDHWGVHCFVTQALYELNMADDVRTGLYIVHRGNWPVPEGLHPTKPLAPPAFLDETGMDWYSHPLDKEHMALKLRAIRSYRTQLPYMGEYLYSFDRRNELFSEYEPADIPYVSGPPSGDPDRFWNHIEPCVLDPVEDSIRVEMGRAGDIKQVKACFDDENVYVRVELARTHSRRLHYGVQVFGLPDATSGRVKLSVSGKGRDMHDAGARLSGDTADFTIPLSRLGRWDALMISADTSIEGRRVDRCAWRVLLSRGGDPTRLPSLQAAGHRDRPPPLSPARKSL